MSNLLKSRNLRLAREYQELLTSPIPNCSAQPLEENIGVWHANMFVPALDLTFHFIIEYPRNYPKTAPKIRNCCRIIDHPNVFGEYICLDILTMSAQTANTPFRGWTSAYTISSLLVQLNSFLFEAMDQERLTHYALKRMQTSVGKFFCTCGHSTHHPTPEIVCFEKPCEISQVSKAFELEHPESYFFLEECDNVVLSMILDFVDQETLGKICFLLEDVTQVVDLVFARRSYKCFYTLSTLNDRGVVFGLGAKRFIMPRRSRRTGIKRNQLQQLHCSFDYLSHEAFQMGVRNNIWKDRDFDCFIPLYINSQHGRRSLHMAEKHILSMWNSPELPVCYHKITADLILTTLTKLMNTTVVNMMKTVEDLEAGELQLFDSIKALGGYTSIYHLLLAFCDRYPSIKETSNSRVKRFINDPLMRDKERAPDIGELLIDLAISDYSWDDFSPAWIEEVFIRNARWILSKYPNLFEAEKFPSCVRLTQSFDATRTGKRLAMFQRFFISEVASPERLKGNPNKNKILLKEYNNRLGMPPKGMAERLQEHSRKVIACSNWWDYFTLVDFCVPSSAHLSAWLRRSVQVSALKRYHEERQILRYPQNFISKPSETIQLDSLHCLCSGSLYKLPENCTKINDEMVLVKPAKKGVDICFVMDCTGSMSAILDTAKNHILDVVTKASKKFGGETVRFAIVGYRDHDSPGWGSDSYVLKTFDFTSNPHTMKANVRQFKIGGGGGPEAMCCAMAAAANMAWNRNSRQIVILIGDQPPHGYVDYNDSYGDGCPCGEDTLRVVHTMTKNGIVVYPVDCGDRCGARQTFYHALARISGGYAFDISDAHLLPEIVVGACAQEGMMEKLTNVVEPLFLECLESHPSGRFEQHCQAVYAECKARDVKVEASLPADGYSKDIEHQVDCIAFCTDIRQAKAMAQSEYFCTINRKTKLCSYMKRPVSLSQVTTCMKRMNHSLRKANFLKNGCQYLNSDRFTKEEFKIRWDDFKSNRKIRKFTPWNKLSSEKTNGYRHIPSPVQTSARALERSRDLITTNLVGRTIEVQLYGVWTSVKIVKFLANCKVCVKFQDVEFTIDDAQDWRPSTAKASWATGKPIQPIASPLLLRELKLMESRGSEKNSNKIPQPTSSSLNSSQTAPSSASGSDSGCSRSSSPGHNFVVGQLVSCKNRAEENWKLAVVGSVAPLYVRFSKENRLHSCRFIVPAKLTTYTLPQSTEVLSSPDEQFRGRSLGNLSAGTQVQFFEVVGDFAHIISPCEAWICLQPKCTREIPAPVVQSRNINTTTNASRHICPAPTPVSSPTVLPMLNILHVPENASARDLANLCMKHGVTPKNIKKVMTRHGISAVIQFSTHGEAQFVHGLRRLSLFGTLMPVQWSHQYLSTLPVRV